MYKLPAIVFFLHRIKYNIIKLHYYIFMFFFFFEGNKNPLHNFSFGVY